MSYTVAICCAELPRDDKAAWELANSLAEDSYDAASEKLARIHEELTAMFPCICDLPDEEVDDGVWSDGPLITNFGQEIAVLGIVFSSVEDVLPVLITIATSHGMTVFDWQTERIYRPGDIILTVDENDPLWDPGPEDVGAAIDLLAENHGCGFAVLEIAPDYIQTAGSDDIFTVEWRQYQGGAFQHWVAGKEGDDESEREIKTEDYELTVKKNECLNSADVKLLFKTFLGHGDMQAEFTWRDMTSQFD